MAKKLSPAQQKAIERLTSEWNGAYTLRSSLPTLNSLVRLGFAEKRDGLGSLFFPRSNVMFRKVKKAP